MGGLVEEDLPLVEVSAKQGWGIPELLDACRHVQNSRRAYFGPNELKPALQQAVSDAAKHKTRRLAQRRHAPLTPRVLHASMTAGDRFFAPVLSVHVTNLQNKRKGTRGTVGLGLSEVTRAIEAGMRAEFGFEGTPIDIRVTAS
jgi:hypothetical protein